MIFITHLAAFLVEVWDELVLGPVHGALLSPHGDERDAALGVIGVHELTESLPSLLVLNFEESVVNATRSRRGF